MTMASGNAGNSSGALLGNKIGSSNVTSTIQQFGLQNASNYNQANSTADMTQNAIAMPTNGIVSPASMITLISNENADNQSNQQTQLQHGVVASNSIPPSASSSLNNDTTGTIAKNNANATTAINSNNNIQQAGGQLASNYNEQNGNTTISQGVVIGPVNATGIVTHGNDVDQYDGQDQGQKAINPTPANSTSG